MKRKLTANQEAAVRAARLIIGLDTAQLSARFNCSEMTIYRALNKTQRQDEKIRRAMKPEFTGDTLQPPR